MKALQLSTSGLSVEPPNLTMPAASFGRSTESHDQGWVSMGAIAARDVIRGLALRCAGELPGGAVGE